jgi:hypothetical protein
MDHDKSTFACGSMASLDTIYCAKEVDELSEQDKPNVGLLVFFRDVWYRYKFVGPWAAIAMAHIKPPSNEKTVVAVSPKGAYWELESKALLEVNGKIKGVRFAIRSMATIDDVIYACGMGRSVLQRNGPGAWDEIGPGTTDKDDGLVVGFEDLAGFSADDMYAVGWRGEIWQRRKGTWRQLDSPVSANLNAICCAADGKVYIVGDNGAMLRGSNDLWEILDTEGIGNLLDVAFYANTVYAVTDFQILKLEDDGLVPEDAFADPNDFPATCLHLLTAPDGLVSMGTKDLFRLRGGVWERLV